MPLHLNSGGGTPHIRYMAQTSSWALSAEHGPQPFHLNEAVFDLSNIRTYGEKQDDGTWKLYIEKGE